MRSAGISRPALAGVAGGTLLYAATVIPLTVWLGPAAGPLSTLPVVLAAALLGWRGGLVVALLCLPLNTLALHLAGFDGWDVVLRHGGGPGFIALLTVALLVGWLRGLVLRLRAGEARLRALYDGSPLPALEWRREGTDFVLVDYNAAAVEFAGGTIPALVGRRSREINHDRPEVVADFERCYAERATIRREYSFTPAGSTERRQVVSTYVFVPPNTVVAHVEDISVRAQVDATRAHLAAVVTASHDAILSQDLAGTILSWNPGAEGLYGYTAEEMIGSSITRVIPPGRANEGLGMRERLVRGESLANHETQQRHKDGRLLDVALTFSPLRDATGQITGISTTARDIGARKAAEEALRRSEANLATAQRIAQVGSWEHDLVTDQLRWSDECFRIAGYAPGAFGPTKERAIASFHPEDRDKLDHAREESITGVAPYAVEHRLVRPDGEVRFVLQQAETICDAAGRPISRVGIIQDITERRALEGRLAYQATHDALTGLPNRTLLLDRLGQSLARARRDGSACAVLFLDLDNFKDVNDTLGHDAGDQLLVAVAGRLRGTVREADTLARLGGDEFIALLEGVADRDEAEFVAGRLAQALAEPLPLAGRVHRLTASLGIVLANGRYARAEDVLRDADVALYRAKNAGKARYAVFDPAMQAAAAARVALEQDLARALGCGELLLHYQPIVALGTGRVTTVEALARWQHPARGVIPPGDFLPVAEESGLIRPLGRWVLRAACAQAAAWSAAGTPVAVAVNLTAREFQDPDLVSEVAAALAGARLDPNLLWLEITEGAAMGDAAATVESLRALKDLGVRLAVDDFGTGYSSLAYLRRFPVDALKIDRAFIDGLGTDAEDTAIVTAIITMAQTLGLSVVAEGVETLAQAAQLRTLGCQLAQGYHFSRPLPPADLAPLLAARSRRDSALVAAAS